MLARVTQDPPRIFPERPAPSMPVKMADVGMIERLRYPLFFNLAPALHEVECTYCYAQTLLDQTRVGCTLERQRLAEGRFPEPTPAFLASLPRDVMNGEPLHYRVAEDGGKPDPKANNQQQPDWGWSVPGK